jgi:phospholipid-transporting ATPase
MVLNGFSLRYALEEEFGLEDKFLRLTRRCKSIICCRVTPAQKAQVVTLAKTRLNKITLAIGDGANDVSMIQAAHVGVGINGEEGLQAVRSSDYAIGQFRFLVPLLLVHGRYSYRRMTKLIMYFFFKNVFLVMTQFWYAIFNGFTGQSLFEQWTLAIYNVVFTSVPIVFFAVVDEDVSRGTVLRNPQLYKDGQTNALFTLPIFLRWVANGIWMSAVVFFMGYGAYQDDLMSLDGQSLGLWVFGYYVFTGLVVVVNLRLAMEIKTWVWYMHVALWASIVSWYVWGAIFSPVWPALKLGSEMYWVAYVAWAQPSYWLCVLLMCVVSLLVTFTWTFVQRTYFPQDYHIIQEQDIVNKHALKLPEEQRPASQMFAPNPNPSAHRGFAFSPGDEAGLRASIRRSKKSPPASATAAAGSAELDRQSSVIGLVTAEDQLLK